MRKYKLICYEPQTKHICSMFFDAYDNKEATKIADEYINALHLGNWYIYRLQWVYKKNTDNVVLTLFKNKEGFWL